MPARSPLPITTFLFDFDGTIANSMSVALDAYNRVAPKAGVLHNTERLRSMSIRELFRTYHISILKIPRMLLRIRAELSAHLDSITIVTGIADVLAKHRQRGCRLGINTSNAEENVQQFLLRHTIEPVEVGSYSVGLWSKACRIKKLIHQHHLHHLETIYIGDTHEDVQSGLKAGVRTAAVSWGYAVRKQLESTRPDYLIDNQSQLLEIP